MPLFLCIFLSILSCSKEKVKERQDVYKRQVKGYLKGVGIYGLPVLMFTLFAAFLRSVSYIAIQGESPMINSFNLFGREADTSFGWNLILVNYDYRIPRNYEVELTELSNGEKVDSRIYPRCV